MVFTVRLTDSIGKAVERLAEQDRRKPSSFLALIVEDAIKALVAQENDAEPKAKKPAEKKGKAK